MHTRAAKGCLSVTVHVQDLFVCNHNHLLLPWREWGKCPEPQVVTGLLPQSLKLPAGVIPLSYTLTCHTEDPRGWGLSVVGTAGSPASGASLTQILAGHRCLWNEMKLTPKQRGKKLI